MHEQNGETIVNYLEIEYKRKSLQVKTDDGLKKKNRN